MCLALCLQWPDSWAVHVLRGVLGGFRASALMHASRLPQKAKHRGHRAAALLSMPKSLLQPLLPESTLAPAQAALQAPCTADVLLMADGCHRDCYVDVSEMSMPQMHLLALHGM